MNLRFGTLYNNGFYHIYNRGVDKRVVFNDKKDSARFELLLKILNSTKNINNLNNICKGDIDEYLSLHKDDKKLVVIHSVAIVKNHFHLILEQLEDNGVSRFMQKLGTAYTKYFNARNNRTGSLFQGKYKYNEIQTDEKLIRLTSYVNRNLEIHNTERSPTSFCTHDFYIGLDVGKGYCYKEPMLRVFGGLDSYKKISDRIIREILNQREYEQDLLE